MQRVVIHVEYGGLGDHLFHSPIPRLLKEKGIADAVYLSGQSKFRSKETYEFVWRNNPYLDGIAHEGRQAPVAVPARVDKLMNRIAAAYGIDGLCEELCPEVYCRPQHNKSYEGLDLLDLNYISFVGALSDWDLIAIAKRCVGYKILNPSRMLRTFVVNETIYSKDFNDYLSMIYSCRHFACLTSGGATVASALRKQATVYYGWGHPDTNRHSSNDNIMVGGGGVYRQVLCRLLFKRNQMRILFSRNK